MKLRLKILSGFFILALMLFVAGIMSIYELGTIGNSVQGLLDDNYKSINAAKQMSEALEREDSGTLLLLSGKLQEGRSIISSGDSLFKAAYEIAHSNVTIPGEKELIDEINTKYRAYKDKWEKPIVGTNKEGNLNWYFYETYQAFLDVNGSVKSLLALNDKAMYQTASSLQSKAHRAVIPGVVAIITAIVFSFIFTFFIHLYVVNPIIKITAGIKSFIKGNEAFHVDIDTKDELLYLKNAVDDMIHYLKAK